MIAAAIAAGGWWRLLTAHIVHLDAAPSAAERTGPGADVGAVCAGLRSHRVVRDRARPAPWRSVRGLWWLSPRVGWYVGASGVLHSVMAAGLRKHLAERAWDRWILLVGFCAKLAYEQLGRPRAAAGGRGCPSVRGHLRICSRGCTLVAYRYNPAPFQRRREAALMSLAFVFPGQGSQSVGMLSALAAVSPVDRGDVRRGLRAVLGYDLVAALPGRSRPRR